MIRSCRQACEKNEVRRQQKNLSGSSLLGLNIIEKNIDNDDGKNDGQKEDSLL